MNRSTLNSFKENPLIKLLAKAFKAAWDAFDISKESEPEEYAGRPLSAYYDDTHTLETSLAEAWKFLVESPKGEEGLSHVMKAAEFVEQKKTWLLDLSRPQLPQENPSLSMDNTQSA